MIEPMKKGEKEEEQKAREGMQRKIAAMKEEAVQSRKQGVRDRAKTEEEKQVRCRVCGTHWLGSEVANRSQKQSKKDRNRAEEGGQEDSAQICLEKSLQGRESTKTGSNSLC